MLKPLVFGARPVGHGSNVPLLAIQGVGEAATKVREGRLFQGLHQHGNVAAETLQKQFRKRDICAFLRGLALSKLYGTPFRPCASRMPRGKRPQT